MCNFYCSTRTPVAACELSCSVTRGALVPNQGWNLSALHCKWILNHWATRKVSALFLMVQILYNRITLLPNQVHIESTEKDISFIKISYCSHIVCLAPKMSPLGYSKHQFLCVQTLSQQYSRYFFLCKFLNIFKVMVFFISFWVKFDADYYKCISKYIFTMFSPLVPR